MKFREKDWTLVFQRMGPVAPKMERIAGHAPSNLISLSEGEGGKRTNTFDVKVRVPKQAKRGSIYYVRIAQNLHDRIVSGCTIVVRII